MSKGAVGWRALLGALLLGACATPEQEAARAEAEARLNAEVSVRQAAAVNRICPRSSDSWRALGDDILLLEARGSWYMAKLAGACDPASAFAVIASRSSPASSCIDRGDNIFTGRPRRGERCIITALYEWESDDQEAPAANERPVAE